MDNKDIQKTRKSYIALGRRLAGLRFRNRIYIAVLNRLTLSEEDKKAETIKKILALDARIKTIEEELIGLAALCVSPDGRISNWLNDVHRLISDLEKDEEIELCCKTLEIMHEPAFQK